MDVGSHVQATLGTAMIPLGIKVHEDQRQEITGEDHPDEYVIYYLAGDSGSEHANGKVIARTTEIYINYYISDAIAFMKDGKKRRNEALNKIRQAMIAAEFDCTDGFTSIGDIERTGYSAWAATFAYSWREDNE